MINEIQLSSLAIGYNKKVILKDIVIASSSNQLICLIGRNGKGKSTLLKTIAGLLPSIAGNIFINHKNIVNLSDKEKSKLLGMVLSQPIEINNITVKDFIAFGRYPYTNWLGINSLTDKTKIEEALILCDLKKLENRNYSQLSDGERKKVNIARVIAQNTPFIILDEPTAHLDLVNKIEVFKLLKKLTNHHNKTIIISTHQIELALQLADKIWLLNDNTIITKTPKDIVKTPSFNQLFNDNLVTFNKETNSFLIKN